MSTSSGSSNPVILEGSDPETLRREALKLAAGWMWDERKVLAGLHVDVSVLDNGSDGMIKVDDVRAIRRDSLLRPFDGEVKVYIIAHAQTMNGNAQNALLRILEEPPPYVRFVLLTHNAGALLPTVRSRCVTRRVTAVDNGQLIADSDGDVKKAESFVGALDDPWRRMAVVYSWDRLSRDALKGVLTAVLTCLRDRCLRDGVKPVYTDTIQTVSGLLPPLDLNASTGSVIGALAVVKEN
ncbi:MAG: hypothetical protein FWG31_09680 [Oscillospiraceae bacterium]|nr:hypothetical protein [Oscillospiraceae bacterium]